MILILLGSQKFQFNRLLKEIDDLIASGIINDNVFAQIGNSDYKPKLYKYTSFIDKNEFLNYINEANLIITHGGTASIITALKAKKKVIAVARLKKYKEHISNHQLDIVRQFSSMKLIIGLEEVKELKKTMENINNYELIEYTSSTSKIIDIIEDFISKNA